MTRISLDLAEVVGSSLAHAAAETARFMNPFDIKGWLFSPHAQHPFAVHFPIALFIASVVLDLFAVWHKRPVLTLAARSNLLGAALMAPIALGTGLIAWQWKLKGVPITGNLRLHIIGASVSTLLLWCLWFIRRRQRLRVHHWSQPPSALYFGIAFVSLGLIIVTAHIGVILAGDY